jgi:hypothetical protein
MRRLVNYRSNRYLHSSCERESFWVDFNSQVTLKVL